MSLPRIIKENQEIPELGKLRDEINAVDAEIVELIAERTEIVKKIADIKDEYGAPTIQTNRWKQVLDKIESLANRHRLEPKFIQNIWEAIHKQSVNAQEKHRKNQ